MLSSTVMDFSRQTNILSPQIRSSINKILIFDGEEQDSKRSLTNLYAINSSKTRSTMHGNLKAK